MLIEFLGQALIVGLCLFLIMFAITSKSENENIMKGLPFFLAIVFIIMVNCYQGGDLFADIALRWTNAG